MSETLETRIDALEAEVRRLKELVEPIKIGDVKGNVSVQITAPSANLSLYVGDVDGDTTVTTHGSVSGLAVNAGDLEEDLAVVTSGAMENVSIKAGDVQGDVICRSEADVKVEKD